MKNNFPFRTHWKKPEEPKAAPETSQYLPRAVELTVEQHKPEEGLRVLLEGFAHYFNCTAEALGPYPLADTAMLIVLYAAYAAKFLSYKPGSELWAYKSLSTVEAQSLSTTDISSLESRNVSYYTTIGSQAMVQGGKVSAGEWIDTIRFRDWLKTQIQQNVINLLLSLPKVPYTDPGIGLVQNAVTAALDAGVEAGGIARPSSDEKTGTVTPSYTITVPKAAELDAATRKTRVLPKVKWTARLAGALIAVEIGGTLNY